MRSKTVIVFLLLTVSLYSQKKSSGQNNKRYSLYGLISKEGSIVLPTEYESISYSLYSYPYSTYHNVEYCKEGKWGIMSTLGEMKIPPTFERIEIASPEGLFWAKLEVINPPHERFDERYWTLYNAKGEFLTGPEYNGKGRTLAGPEYTHIDNYENGLVAVRTTQGAGVLDIKGNEVIPCIYEKAKLYNKGHFIFLKKGEEQGVAYASGKIIIPLRKQEIEMDIDMQSSGNRNKELVVVSIDNKIGLIDSAGHWLLEPKYDTFYLDKYFGYVRENNRYGLTTLFGEIIGSVDYDYVDPLHMRGYGGGAILQKGDRWSYIDSTGTELFYSKHKIIENISYMCPSVFPTPYCPRLFVLHDSIGYSIYDLYGNVLEESSTDKSPTNTWRCFQGKDKLLGYKDTWRHVTIYPQYKRVSDNFRYGYAVVQPKKKLGIIDKCNNMVIPAEYDFASIISPNSCVLKKKGKIAFFDMQGNPLTPFLYKRVREIQGGYVSVLKDKYLGVCKASTGKEVIPCQYESIGFFSEQYFFYIIVSQNKKEGLVDLQSGKTVVPCVYDEIKMDPQRTGSALIRQGDQWGVMDLSSSQEIVSCQWDEIKPISFNKKEISTKLTINGENYKGIPKMFMVKKGSLWGLLDESGKEVISPVYTSIGKFHNDLLIVGKEIGSQNATK